MLTCESRWDIRETQIAIQILSNVVNRLGRKVVAEDGIVFISTCARNR